MRSLVELRNEIRDKSTLDDVIEAVIYGSKQTIIPKSQAFLHRAFLRLQKEEPELFSGLIFDESGVTPFSDELDSVLFRLEASHVLHTLNPAYKNYQIDNTREMMKGSFDKLTDKRDVIIRCASVFSEMIQANDRGIK